MFIFQDLNFDATLLYFRSIHQYKFTNTILFATFLRNKYNIKFRLKINILRFKI